MSSNIMISFALPAFTFISPRHLLGIGDTEVAPYGTASWGSPQGASAATHRRYATFEATPKKGTYGAITIIAVPNFKG